jgi:hypothetical protein
MCVFLSSILFHLYQSVGVSIFLLSVTPHRRRKKNDDGRRVSDGAAARKSVL